jgi:hypothetical protein
MAMATSSKTRSPGWYGIPVRVLLVTFLITILVFAVSLLLGIVGLVLVAKSRDSTPNLTLAYRHIAFPVAVVAGTIVLVLSLAMEIRRYRQSKVLRDIERLHSS